MYFTPIKNIEKKTDCSKILKFFLYTKIIFAYCKSKGKGSGSARGWLIDRCTFLVYANHRRPESRVQTSHLVEEKKEIALGRGCVPWANQCAGYTDGLVCTKPVLSIVSITADERRVWSANARRFKAEESRFTAPISLRSLRGTKDPARGAVSERKIVSMRAR